MHIIIEKLKEEVLQLKKKLANGETIPMESLMQQSPQTKEEEDKQQDTSGTQISSSIDLIQL